MKRAFAVIVLATFRRGCVALQRTPDATVLRSLRTIAVIPLEAPPPPKEWAHKVRGGGATVAGGEILIPVVVSVLIVYGIYRLADTATKSAPIPEGTLTMKKGPPVESWMLTVDLAKTAAETLQRHEARTVYLVDGYVRLPRVALSPSQADVDSQVKTRINRWHNEDLTPIDYSGLGLAGLDAIPEVGIFDYECVDIDNNLVLQVMVRLLDPATKQVLGRARNFTVPHPFTPRVKPDERKHVTKVTGQTLVTQCLKDLGLIAE